MATEAGISRKTLRRASESLGIVKGKPGMKAGWVWSLPPKMPKTPEDDLHPCEWNLPVRRSSRYPTGRGITPSQNMSADDLAAHVAVVPGKAPLFKLVGYWTGKSMIANRGACDIKLEVRPTPENQFSGFVTVGCMSFMQPKKIAPGVLSQLGKETPVSAVLSGGWDATAGSLKLLATKNIGFDQSGKGCAMTSLTVTPFGKGQVAAEWQDPACSGGQMILARSTP